MGVVVVFVSVLLLGGLFFIAFRMDQRATARIEDEQQREEKRVIGRELRRVVIVRLVLVVGGVVIAGLAAYSHVSFMIAVGFFFTILGIPKIKSHSGILKYIG